MKKVRNQYALKAIQATGAGAHRSKKTYSRTRKHKPEYEAWHENFEENPENLTTVYLEEFICADHEEEFLESNGQKRLCLYCKHDLLERHIKEQDAEIKQLRKTILRIREELDDYTNGEWDFSKFETSEWK